MSFGGVKNVLRGAKDPAKALSTARKQMSVSDYVSLVDWLATNDFLKRRYLGEGFPQSAGAVMRRRVPEVLDLEREIRWAHALLVGDARRLREYVSALRELEGDVLRKDSSEVLDSLARIEGTFGESMWLVKTRLAFLQVSGGLEAQKEYALKIKRDNDFAGPLAYLTHQWSVRNEPKTTVSRFRTQMRQHFESWELPPHLTGLFRAELSYWSGVRLPQPTDLLVGGTRLPAIDRYENFVRSVALLPGEYRLSGSARYALSQVTQLVQDERLQWLEWRLGLTAVQPAPRDGVRAAEGAYQLLLAQDVEAAAGVVREALAVDPSCSLLLGVAGLTAAHTPDALRVDGPGLLPEVLGAISGTFSGPDVDSQFQHSDKLLLNLAGLPFAGELRALLFRESAEVMLLDRGEAEAAHLLSKTARGGGVVAERLLQVSGNGFGARVGDEALLCLLRDEPSHPERAAIASELSASRRPYYRLRGRAALIREHMNGDRPVAAAEALARWSITGDRLELAPLAVEVLELLVDEGLPNVAGNVGVPVLFDLFHRHVGPRFDNERRFAYEDCLASHGLQRPSEAKAVVSGVDQDLWVYYLHHVCVESVMDVSPIFASSRELAEERLAVCRMLVELLPNDADEFQDEIKDLVRRLMLETRLRQIEQSKVYVDRAGVRQVLLTTLREPYRRYEEYRRHGGPAPLPEGRLAELEREVLRGNTEALASLRVPEDERLALLSSMLEEATSAFLNNPEYGLDVFLSVRVRHGTLSGHLRTPLEDAHLITQRHPQASGYKANSYWPERVRWWSSGPDSQASGEERLQAALAEFSEAFDGLIQTINKEWLQVGARGKNPGLFGFTFPSSLPVVLEMELPGDASLEVFVDSLLDILWAALGQRLDVVRRKMRDEAKRKAMDLLTRLESKTDSLPDCDAGELLSTIRSTRTDLQHTFDRATEWFRLPKVTVDEPFTLSEAVDIAVETAKTSEKQLCVNTTAEGEPFWFKGRLLSSFVDIFFILMENIVRHSGLEGEIPVEVDVGFGEDTLSIVVSNALGAGVDLPSVDARIANLMGAIESAGVSAAVSTEGGTGFLKVSRILRRDFAQPTSLVARIVDGSFQARFTLTVLARADYEDPSD